MNITDLLAKWAEVERERCRLEFVFGRQAYQMRLAADGDWWWIVDEERDQALRLLYGGMDAAPLAALLQAAVQEAVEAHGWGWRLYRCAEQGSGNPRYHATVDRDLPTRRGGTDTAGRASDVTAGGALLTAYLEALKA